LNFAADTISAVAGGYASSLTAASTTGKVIKGAKVAKDIGAVARGRTSVPPPARIPKEGRAYKKTSTLYSRNISPQQAAPSEFSDSKWRSKTKQTYSSDLSKSPYDQRGYKPTNWDRFKFNLKNRRFRPFTNWNTALDWRSNKKTY